MPLKKTVLSFGLYLLVACSSSKSSGDRQGAAAETLLLPTQATGSLVQAHVSGNDTNEVLIRADQEGPIKGTSVRLPVGTFLGDTDITIELGESLTSATTATDLGTPDAGAFEPASAAIVLKATPDSSAAAKPFQLSIPLTRPDKAKLVVLARYPKPAPAGQVYLALLGPEAAHQLGNVMVIAAPALGAYQVAHVSGNVPPSGVEVVSSLPVLGKGEQLPATAAKLVDFTITSPLAAVNSATPLAAWSGAGGAVSYDVSVGKTAKCADKLQDFPQVSDLTKTLDPLPDGGYFICVTAHSAASAAAATNDGAAFTVAATAPARFKIHGVPGHVAKSGTPTVAWDASVGATSYIMSVAAAPGCASPSQVFGAVTAPSQATNKLVDGTYYVCVEALNAAAARRLADNSDYQLIINSQPPGAFTIFSPTFDVPSATLYLNWGTSANAVSYDVAFAKDAACATPVKSVKGVGTLKLAVVGVASGPYNVCVTANDAAGNSTVATNNGAGFVLDVNGPPGAFTISGPSGTVYTATPTVAWTAATGAASYNVGIGSGIGCASPRKQTYTGITATSVMLTALPDDGYRACVTAFDGQNATTEATNDALAFEVESSTVHIAYLTLNNGVYNLKYAALTNGAWAADSTAIETASAGNAIDPRVSLTLSNADVPQVGYALSTSGNIAAKYARRTGPNTWAAEVVENLSAGAGTYGRYNALALATDNTVKLAYVHDNGTNALIRLASGTTGAFTPASVDTAPLTGSVGDVAVAMTKANQLEFAESVNNGGTWTVTYRNSSNFATTATGLTNAGCTQMLQASLAVDPLGATHIAYGCVTAGGSCQVYYLKRSGGVFGTSELVGTIALLGCTAAQLSGEAYRPRLAVDSSNIPRIVWWDESGANLKYATRASGSWQVTTPVATATVTGHAAIALDVFDKAYLFYQDNSGLHSLSNNADSATPTWSTPILVDANVVSLSDPAVSGVAFRSSR